MNSQKWQSDQTTVPRHSVERRSGVIHRNVIGRTVVALKQPNKRHTTVAVGPRKKFYKNLEVDLVIK
jgi:hypothetical protein